jgi:glycosyltransferase involved in cell wall biosynthesis
MSQPIVSVIIPTKNSSRTLEECLSSIKSQSYSAIELIVVDNFSTDNTLSIAKKYTQHVYSKGPERSPQRNYGVSKAEGTYIAIIDSDMNLSPKVIEQAVAEMKKNVTLAGIVIPEESFGDGFWAQCKRLERSFYVGVPYMEAARFFKRSDYLHLGGYDKTMVSGEDWDLSQRMESIGSLGRTKAYIYHNEGHISLWQSVRKKFYYAEKFTKYKDSNETVDNISPQTSIIGRYALFFSKPRKLFKKPLLGIGMLFMKTCEFCFGAAGYIKVRIQQ